MIPDHVLQCMRELSEAGHEAWLVGGAVRDFCLGKIPTDFDLATDATPDRMLVIFSDRRILSTGIRHGTITVFFGAHPLEITSFRKEGTYSDGRRPDFVTFTSCLNSDLTRRDFTINALAMNENGLLIDMFGGCDDLSDGLIRCVGKPMERFREDSLRVLRALRFASTLGFRIEPQTSDALRACAVLLGSISAERVWEEFIPLICGGNVGPVLENYDDVIAQIIPEIRPMKGFHQHNPYHHLDVWTHTVRVVENVPPEKTVRLAALFHDIGKPGTFSSDEKGVGHFYGHEIKGANIAYDVLGRMRSDSATRADVKQLVAIHCIPVSPDEMTVRRRLNQYGPEIFNQLIDIKIADAKAQSGLCSGRIDALLESKERARECILLKKCFTKGNLMINGSDLMEEGMSPGPKMGRLLEEILGKVIAGELSNERECLIRYAKSRLLQGSFDSEKDG